MIQQETVFGIGRSDTTNHAHARFCRAARVLNSLWFPVSRLGDRGDGLVGPSRD